MYFSWSFNVLCVAIIPSVAVVIHRLFFHRLRSFNGPVLAAATSWYRAYWDLIRVGGFVDHVKDLHERYGAIVRIGPNELHFNDPKAYAEIYFVGSKFLKEPSFYECFGEDESSFGYIDPHSAKVRREILSPLFSRRAIIRLENVIQHKVDKLVSILSSYTSRRPANLSMAYRSLTLDIISSYCFAQCFDALENENFAHPVLASMQKAIPVLWSLKHLPFLKMIMSWAPDWFILRVSPQFQGLNDLHKHLAVQVDSLLSDPASLEDAEHEIIYHHLLTPNPGKSHSSTPSRKSLLDEAFALMTAGSDTVGNTCTVGTFYVLDNPSVRNILMRELSDAWPDPDFPMTFERLEKLPYLTAVIKESLRIAHGIVTPLPRVINPAGAIILGSHIPAGTVVGMTVVAMHYNVDVFPNPLTFSPERWLGENVRELESHLVPFSRGPRMCLGINLAWTELYLIFGNIFRRMNMELYNTTVKDFEFMDYFVPIAKGKPLHVLIKSEAPSAST